MLFGRLLLMAVLTSGAAHAQSPAPDQIPADQVVIGTGTLMPHKSSSLGPLVEGRIERIHVNVGDRVEAGMPLFEIRAGGYRLRVEEMKAALAVAEARLKQAQLTLNRSDRLADRGVTSMASHDSASSAVLVATAEVDLARARLRQAEQDLSDTVVRAPFRGTITARLVDEGVFLTNRVPGGSGSSVIQIQKIDILVAIVRIPSRDLSHMSLGTPATLRVDGVDRPVAAKVDVINDMVDVATRTVEIRLGVDNSDYAIRPGVFVQAELRHAASVKKRAEATGSIR